jgi:LuxR family maltose regulon positive regulatory protein
MLVSAPAGFGKTSLLNEWLAVGSAPGAVVRVPLGPETQGPAAFWSTVRSATGVASREALAALDAPLVLVLDDFHLVRSPEVAADFDWLLDKGVEGLHLLVSTRSDPSLRLERLRLSGLMAELRAADLAFSLDETRELLSGFDLSDEDMELLWRRTEGWVGGLRLAQLSLEDRVDAHAFVTSFAGDDRAVSDYLMSEVVNRQPPERLDFLLRTCIPGRITGALADALTGEHDGEGTLRGLERGDGLVSAIDGHGRWYRYHPLLLEVLRAESRRRLPEEQARLHLLAARWHAANGSALEAVRHAVEAAAWDVAAEVIGERWMGLMTRGSGAALLELAERIPREVVRADAELALAVAGLRLEAGDDAGADELLGEAFRRAPELPERRARRFEVTSTAVALYRARLRGDVEAALTAALLVIDEDWGRDLDVEVRALTLVNLGIAEFWVADTDSATGHLQQAVGLALESGNDFLLFLAQSYASAVDVQTGRLAEASARAHIAIQLAERRGWTGVAHAAMAYAALGSAHFWLGELGEAEHFARRAAKALVGSGEPLLNPGVSLLRACLLALGGEPVTALDMVRGATAQAPVPRLLAVSAGLLEAELLLVLGEPERARSVLAALDAPDAALGAAQVELAEGNPAAASESIAAFRADEREPLTPFARVQAAVLDAIANDALRDQPAALDALEHALDMAEPRGCSIVIVRYGPPLRSLLRRLLAAGTRHRALVDELLAMLDRRRTAEPASAPLLEPLSERELTVLRYLPTMMSNADIAAEMFVSVNTVKTHLKHVYRKLDVTDRRDCVRRGRELRLLRPGVGASGGSSRSARTAP